jgi:lipopolysaccharide export system protein LptC
MPAMSDRFTAWFPLLLLAALAALTLWLDRVVQPPARAGASSARHDPDYIVDGLSALRMAPDGTIKYTLHARKMIHYPDDDTTRLDAPRFVSYATAKAPVTVTAREAFVSSEGENVYFKEDVVVRRAPYGDQSELVMYTTYLHVIPDAHVVKTDRAVTIKDAHIEVTAVGLELNSETRVLKLLSRVKGVYHDPNRAARRRGG